MGLFGSNVLFWPGCYSSALLKSKTSNYIRILRKLGTSFTTTDKMACCAGCLINAGYDKESRKLARENFEILSKLGVTQIITSCPLCYKTFSQDYNEMLPEWDIQTGPVLVVILNELKENPKLIKTPPPLEEKIIYHDSCYLGRYSKIYQEPRAILELLGYDVIELPNNMENATCTGSCGNLAVTNPDLADIMAKNFIKQIKQTNVKKIVTADPQAYIHLRKNLADTGIELFEFSELLCKALNIWT